MIKDPIDQVFPDLCPSGRQIVDGLVEAVAKRIIQQFVQQFVTNLVLTIEGDQKIHWPDYPGAAQ